MPVAMRNSIIEILYIHRFETVDTHNVAKVIELCVAKAIDLCFRYHVTCNDSDSFMSVTVGSLDLEPAAQCQLLTNSCLDYIQLHYPTGTRILTTVC